MPDRICSIPQCGNMNTPHRARLGAGYWCGTCLDHWRRHGADPANRTGLRVVPDTCTVVENGERRPRPVAVKRDGWCEMHRKLARNNAGATRRKRTGRGGLLSLVRAAAVATQEECIVPAGWKVQPGGRGARRPMVKLDGRMMTAARAVWNLAHGDPGQAHVLHRCNDGDGSHGCVNIRHLYVGDNAQNARDRVEAERQARGEGHGGHILVEDDVQQIRRRHVPGRGPYDRGNTLDLAAEYAVAPTTIRNAVSGRSWAHLAKRTPGGDHDGD
jgi:hypothetical protein